MRRSESLSSESNSACSGNWNEAKDFPTYEDLFYRPPSLEHSELQRPSGPIVVENRLPDDDNEAPLRALLDEMRDWCVENSDEVFKRLNKPLPAPPESDDEHAYDPSAPRRTYSKDADFHVTPSSSNSTTPSSSPSRLLRTPTSSPILRRPFADVPQSPTCDAFIDSPCPSPALPQASVRARSISMTPPITTRSEVILNQRRPPPLQASSASLGPDRMLLKAGFNKSFSAPSTPTAMEFLHAKTDRQSRRMQQLPYGAAPGHLMPGDFSVRGATHSRWSLSTAGQDDIPVVSPNTGSLSPQTRGENMKRSIVRSPSRVSLGLSFAKFELGRIMRFPSRSGSRKRLIVQGVIAGDEPAVQCVKEWCEVSS
ncbi:hypothetical protein DFH11DRAFT_1243393 [Phellopilus nigrolimitatus]|nr:hypothetical protein DFH11DRAFT_1243393 [Phellopilus nigrolimitatus]